MAPDAGTPRRCDTTAISACDTDCPTCPRLRSALRSILDSRSWDELTVAAVAEVAGVQATDLLAHYPSLVACGAAAVDEAAADCYAACAATYPTWQNCSQRFFGLSETVLSWMEARPAMARLLFVVAEQTREPALLDGVAGFKRRLIGLFGRPGHCTPAGRTHVEFVIGLFFQAAHQQLVSGAEPGTLRRHVLALAPFVEPPPTQR